jgi:acetyl-CoA synthetase
VSPKIFESILVAHAEVSEAAGIGVPDSIKGEALVCFCVLKKNANWSGSGRIALAAELKENVARGLGKAFAPREVIFVGDIPKNAERESDAPHRSRGVFRRKTRRHFRVGKPGVAG